MTVDLIAHFEDMVQQLMIVKGLSSPEQVVEQAIAAMYRRLSKAERQAALARMVQDGFDSGPANQTPEEIFAEIFAELDLARRKEQSIPTERAA